MELNLDLIMKVSPRHEENLGTSKRYPEVSTSKFSLSQTCFNFLRELTSSDPLNTIGMWCANFSGLLLIHTIFLLKI